MDVIAKPRESKKGMPAGIMRFSALVFLSLALGGCVSSLDFFGSSADGTITTSAIAPNKSVEALSDEATVRNAVTSADLSKLGSAPLPWANASTGSAGVVTAVREERSGSNVCRSFTTTRHAFDGIASFSGNTCLDGRGEWQLMSFTRQN